MIQNNLGQFTRNGWSMIVSTFKFMGWFLKLLFSKEGLQQIVFVVGLGLATAFLLIYFEVSAFFVPSYRLLTTYLVGSR